MTKNGHPSSNNKSPFYRWLTMLCYVPIIVRLRFSLSHIKTETESLVYIGPFHSIFYLFIVSYQEYTVTFSTILTERTLNSHYPSLFFNHLIITKCCKIKMLFIKNGILDSHSERYVWHIGVQ
jgi:hypothetical protein